MWSLSSVPPKPMMNSRPYDELYTPVEALLPLTYHLSATGWPQRMAWECAPGSMQLVDHLLKRGYRVVCNDRHDFLKDDPSWDYDWMITNPPYSLKAKWLKRANELGKPWAFLLPVTTLGVRACQKELDGAQIVFLPKRIDFTGKKAPWFAVAWFTRGLDLPVGKELIFP